MARRPKPASVLEILSMSALGQKRMLSADLGCPLHPLRADMLSVGIHVCKVPLADSCLRLAKGSCPLIRPILSYRGLSKSLVGNMPRV